MKSEVERQLGLARLEKWELIEAFRSWGGKIVKALAKPALAEIPDIHGLHTDHYEARAYVDQRVTNTTNVSGGYVGGIQTGGSGNTMNVTQSVAPMEQAGIIAKVAEILSALDGVEGVDNLRFAVEAIGDQAAKPDATKPNVRQKVIDAMTVAGSVASITQAVGPATVLLSQLLSLVTG